MTVWREIFAKLPDTHRRRAILGEKDIITKVPMGIAAWHGGNGSSRGVFNVIAQIRVYVAQRSSIGLFDASFLS
ncbi:hypothetical protein FH972_022923 [Carpinus fangiana]|uniref:Uncharacterized protein n=1 Tax=Carpinus fangiana TaxID=176857 RepID=A0A5N6KUB7_9ROSI|nr:hypothetical protein FH972_022923 [Carpinus fangiana]